MAPTKSGETGLGLARWFTFHASSLAADMLDARVPQLSGRQDRQYAQDAGQQRPQMNEAVGRSAQHYDSERQRRNRFLKLDVPVHRDERVELPGSPLEEFAVGDASPTEAHYRVDIMTREARGQIDRDVLVK